MWAISTAAQRREGESEPPVIVVRELDQQASNSQFGRSRTLLRRGKQKPAKRCEQWSDYCKCGECWAQASNVEKIAVVSDRKEVLHNVMRAILNWEQRDASPTFFRLNHCTLHCTSRSTLTTIFQSSTRPVLGERRQRLESRPPTKCSASCGTIN